MNFRDCWSHPWTDISGGNAGDQTAGHYGQRTKKKVKVAVEEFDGVPAVAADFQSEPFDIAESDADTETAIY